MSSLSTGQIVCVRFKVSDMQLYNPEHIPDHEWRWRWEQIRPPRRRNSEDGEIIKVSEGLSKLFFELPVQKHTSRSSATANGSGRCGSGSRPYQPIYMLLDFELTRTNLVAYIPRISGSLLQKFSGPSNLLVNKTYRQGCKLLQDSQADADTRRLLSDVFKLWAATRLLKMHLFIVQATGSANNEDLTPTSNLEKISSVPSSLSGQLVFIFTHYIQLAIRKPLLDRLNSMFYRNNKSSWLTLYVATFVLLHSLTLLAVADAYELSTPQKTVRLTSLFTSVLTIARMSMSDWQNIYREKQQRELFAAYSAGERTHRLTDLSWGCNHLLTIVRTPQTQTSCSPIFTIVEEVAIR